jgi:hypothetical protein
MMSSSAEHTSSNQQAGVCNLAQDKKEGSSASTATFDLAEKLDDRGIGKLELLPRENMQI